MGQAILSVRMDSEVKKEFDAFCADVGMNTSVAVNMFVKTVLRERRIPFEISNADPFYSKANMERLSAAAARMEARGGIVHELMEADD
ncbi:type II toxin-antitoxin system RelB/DinJ family antitoxin [Cloacibacillus porcorum]|uniref:type II toxin-antitoxin system RelB/DinJ family antitoxin n=2 Tax=Cloacibacillus TaxID=508459 RepID=UPI00258A4365|nr:type II toxin-antitoxin system RelB/DinJ family antitoxin [Cloacibacillus porcorum]